MAISETTSFESVAVTALCQVLAGTGQTCCYWFGKG